MGQYTVRCQIPMNNIIDQYFILSAMLPQISAGEMMAKVN
jgi:hypothetical protein